MIMCQRQDCEVLFKPNTHNQRYCSAECCRIETNARLKERYHANKARKKGDRRLCATPGCQALLSRYNDEDHCAQCVTARRKRNNNAILELIGYGTRVA